jgi:hypothetical protein
MREGKMTRWGKLAGLSALALMGACASVPKQAPPVLAPPPAPEPEAAPPGAPAPPIPRVTRGLSAPVDPADVFEMMPAPSAGGGAPGTAFDPGPPGKDYLPFIDVAINAAVTAAQYGKPLQDRYTRLQIVTLKPEAFDFNQVASGLPKANVETRDYTEESRNWFSRMMSSRNVTRTLIAEFDVAKPDIKATKALFSASFDSDSKKGETWSTSESLSVYATPFFKVGPNTTIEGRFRMQLANERKTSAGANVMGALTQAANLIAPASTLVTYFNAPLMLEASNFLNNSAGALFGQSITEQSVSAFSVTNWTDQPIVVVSARVPEPGNIKDTKESGSVGTWAVYLDEPIASVFTAQEGANDLPDFTSVTAGDILAFEVGEDLTVYDYVFSRLDLADRITAINRGPDVNTASLICTRMSRGLSEIGFTSFDAAAAVWAASASDQFNIQARNALQQRGICDSMDLWIDMKG